MNEISDIHNDLQRKSILKICSQILSIPFNRINSCITLEDEGYFDDNADKLYQEVFQRNNIRVAHHYTLNDVQRRLYTRHLKIEYDKNTLKKIIPICERWFTPLADNLKNLDKEKRNEWNQNYNIKNSVDELKNCLLTSTDVIPGFKYLIDIQWENEDHNNANNKGLIFGSDYGIYLVIVIRWINMNYGQRAKRSRIDARINVKDQARKFKKFAISKYGNDAIKIIGASYTNDTENEKLQFVDDQDREIATIIKNAHYRVRYLTYFIIVLVVLFLWLVDALNHKK